MQHSGGMWRLASALVLFAVCLPMSSANELENHSAVFENDCDQLYNAFGKKPNNETKHEKKKLTLASNGWYEHAGAAMVRARLISTGYNPNDVMLHNAAEAPLVLSNDTVVVNVTLEHKLLIQVRLSPRTANLIYCKQIAAGYIYMDVETMRKCDFHTQGAKKREYGVYIAEDLDYLKSKKIKSFYYYVMLVLMKTTRSHLKHSIRESNSSFFFYDTDNWRHFENVHILEKTYAHITILHCGLSNPLIQLALTKLGLFERYKVFENELRSIYLKNEMENDACRVLIGSMNENLRYNRRVSVLADKKYIILIIIDVWYYNMDYYEDLVKELQYINFSNKDILYSSVSIQIESEENLMTYNLRKYNITKKILGVVLMSNNVIMSPELEAKLKKWDLPLVAYDVASKRRTNESGAIYHVTGSLSDYVDSLRHLLTICDRRRFAVITDNSNISLAVVDELNNIKLGRVFSINVLNDYLKLYSSIIDALKTLITLGARIILVNTDAETAAKVLEAALGLNMTRDEGFLWIVRDYDNIDSATASIKPLSLSFRWRGSVANETVETMLNDGPAAELRSRLDKICKGYAWPQHTASIVDAYLTIAAGLQRLYAYNSSLVLSSPWEGEILRKFWSLVEEEKIPGLLQDLEYQNGSLKSPLVFVEEWGAGPRPRHLAMWRVGEWSNECPVVNPPPDGSVRCLVPVGDPFYPECRDTVLIASVIGALAIVSLLAAAFWLARRAIAARDARIKSDYARRLLTRRERVFAALAAHLVERSSLDLHEELGSGRFGRVWLGVVRAHGRERRTGVVAVKALREEAGPAEESEFLREACTLAELEHEHIVRFVGVCIVDGPPLLLMEHAFFGDLLSYLQSRRYIVDRATGETASEPIGVEERSHVSAEALTKLAREAAEALAYLSRCRIVHRDVRASNCLVDVRRSLKLGDFGLARATGTVDGEYVSRRRGLFPVLWMAPESLETGVFSAPSDVWAFGVVVFELVTLGRRPYGSQPPPSVLQHVVGGGRPRLPWDAGAETRALVRACWRRAPEARPAAAQVARWLARRRRALRPALATDLVEVDEPGPGTVTELDELARAADDGDASFAGAP